MSSSLELLYQVFLWYLVCWCTVLWEHRRKHSYFCNLSASMCLLLRRHGVFCGLSLEASFLSSRCLYLCSQIYNVGVVYLVSIAENLPFHLISLSVVLSTWWERFILSPLGISWLVFDAYLCDVRFLFQHIESPEPAVTHHYICLCYWLQRHKFSRQC